jgi:hypothetical protein
MTDLVTMIVSSSKIIAVQSTIAVDVVAKIIVLIAVWLWYYCCGCGFTPSNSCAGLWAVRRLW